MTYRIKKGDTLSQIAVDHKTTVDMLMLANPHIKDKDKIYEGDLINIPSLPDYVKDVGNWWTKAFNWYKGLFRF